MVTAPTAPILQPPARVLGEFRATGAERLPHGFLFFCDYGNWLDENGLAFSIQPLPRELNNRDYFTHIKGDWYTVI
ncbi:MAG TPA: hypothetical protein VHY37_14350 [Tepidisphaeraceae bacterium]|jgi:hypothetical protein|nr:hypothetical protein [Tepidisphaeraceae bacterium]